MITFKPKQALLHALPNTGSTSVACDHHEGPPQPDRSSNLGEFIARVTAVDRDQYIIKNVEGEVPAKLTGRAVYFSKSPVDPPCVGDWVRVRYRDSGAHASILDVLPRKSFLRRKRPGGNVEFQMIAANIDVAFIVQSCHFDFNVRRLERYLVITSEGHIEPVVLLTKTDLISRAAREQLVSMIRDAGISTKIIALSNISEKGVDLVRELIQPGKTYCLLGSSGVGKTTLINRLVHDLKDWSPLQQAGAMHSASSLIVCSVAL